MKKVAEMVEAFKEHFPRLTQALTFARPCLAATKAVQENIRVTLEAAQDSITTLYNRRENCDDEHVSHPKFRRRTSDRL